MSKDVGNVLLSIHQGEFLGTFLMPIYVIAVGSGAVLLLITGINMTGIFRRKRQTKAE
jgi:hypothetical protein